MTTIFPIDDFSLTKQKVLNWISQFSTFCFLDNNQYTFQPHSEECLAGAGIIRNISADNGATLSNLQNFIDAKPAWLFGHLNYELKHSQDNRKDNRIQFPDFFFFEPEIRLQIRPSELIIEADEPALVFKQIIASSQLLNDSSYPELEIRQRLQKEDYLEIIRKLQAHILRGDCYEINFCQEFFAEHAHINPLEVYQQLVRLSPNPFSGLYRLNDKWLLCASPERYLKKEGLKLISQPIKGTAERKSTETDDSTRLDLQTSEKDRAENVMVVDLVRNDLSKICVEGSVLVDELFGVYSFPHVHQMISSISGLLKSNVDFQSIIEASFPMGSMTGAPKKSVMELIDQYEDYSRGIFSGALGYIDPSGDFDFNVVIRSIMYNQTEEYLSFLAGSGITFYSDPINEWEECLLKAKAIMTVLRSQNAD